MLKIILNKLYDTPPQGSIFPKKMIPDTVFPRAI